MRLLAVCCVVDVLRIYAPEAPYSPEELKHIFEAIVSQLHGIATITDSGSPSAEKYFYILENLATVKSCIILVELTQQGVDGAAELLSELFQALFGSIRCANIDICPKVRAAGCVICDFGDEQASPLNSSGRVHECCACRVP